MKEDPKFKANLAKFMGHEPSSQDKMYANYRAFYGAATPGLDKVAHMSKKTQD